MIRTLIRKIMWFCRNDVDLVEVFISGLDYEKRINSFYILSKKRFSWSYNWCGTIAITSVYPLLSSIEEGIKNKKSVDVELGSHLGSKRIILKKGHLKKTKELIEKMIKEIQEQY